MTGHLSELLPVAFGLCSL